MKHQRGSALTIALSVLGFVAIVAAVHAVSYISAHNKGNAMEQTLKATYKNNENIRATYGQKVMEAAQVPEMARDDIAKVAREAIGGRYGDGGSKAVFQAIVEQNPTVDPELYRKLQQIVEAGRTEFQTAQTLLLDQKRLYETELGSFWSGMWLRIAGYPKVNLDDFKMVTTEDAARAFETGKDAPLQLRPGPAAK